MDYKPYKRIALKVSLWMGSIMAIAILAGLLGIFFTILDHKIRLTLAVEYLFTVFFLMLFYFCFILNRIFYRAMITVEKTVWSDNTENIVFKGSFSTHIINIFLAIVIFLLIPACYNGVIKESYGNALKDTLCISLPLFFYTIIFTYLYFYIFLYLLNQSIDFKVNLKNLLAKEGHKKQK